MQQDTNSIIEERQHAGCNGISCNYQFQPIDVEEVEGQTNIVRGIQFCTFCAHIEECYFRNPNSNAIQESGT